MPKNIYFKLRVTLCKVKHVVFDEEKKLWLALCHGCVIWSVKLLFVYLFICCLLLLYVSLSSGLLVNTISENFKHSSTRSWRVDFGFGKVDFLFPCPDGPAENFQKLFFPYVWIFVSCWQFFVIFSWQVDFFPAT